MGSLATAITQWTSHLGLLIIIMDLQSNQICRLLEYAAAMSSAQEKVTGSGKLDMAGVMAALARQEEALPHTNVSGQRSFLHSNYCNSNNSINNNDISNNKSNSNSNSNYSTGLVRAEYVRTSMEETASAGLRRDQAKVSAGTRNYNEEQSSDSAQLSRNTAVKNIVQSADLSARTGRKKVSECRAAFENMTSNSSQAQSSISSSSSSLESSPRQDKKWLDQAGSGPSLKSSLGVAKYLRQANNECEKTDTKIAVIQPRNTQETITGKHSQERQERQDRQDKPGDMAGFLSVVEKLSEEKERRTGNGRLDMSELLSALNDFQSKPPQAAAGQAGSGGSGGTEGTAASGGQTGSGGSVGPASQGSPTPPPVPARPPALTPAGPPRPPPIPVLVSSQTELSKTTNNNSLKTNKSSLLKSQLNQNIEKQQQQQQQHAMSSTQQTSFYEEKSCLMGELKSKLNKENNSVEETKHQTPRRNLQTSNPSQDQMVNKIVYNQYREMLNSYRNNK